MALPQIVKYPFDPTGVSPVNKVVAERHSLVTGRNRILVPVFGPFYTESLELIDTNNNRVLTRGMDYHAVEYLETPSKITGKEICSLLLITDQTASSELSLTYQVVGGEYSRSLEAIVEALKALDLDNRPVHWPDIIDLPTNFKPASHLHDVGDTYGWEYITQALENLRRAILLGDVASHDEILAFIDRVKAELDARLDSQNDDLDAHKADKDNPHSVTKAQVGLSNTPNYSMATNEENKLGATNNKFTSPYGIRLYVNENIVPVINAHKADKDNPHSVTKAQVGLSNTPNYSMATNEENKLGATNNKFTSPYGIRLYVNENIVPVINAHKADKDNPHSVTKAQVGLSNTPNYSMASNAEALTRVEERFLNPRGLQHVLDGYMKLDGSRAFSGPITGHKASLAMVTGTNNNNGSFIARASGGGDANLAGITFWHDSYMIRAGVRSDGVWGVGGGSSSPWRFYTTVSGDLVSLGDVVAYSDPRLKYNFKKVSKALDIISSINGYYYNWKEGKVETQLKSKETDVGLNSEEVKKVLPMAVTTSAPLDSDGVTYDQVAYSKLIPVLVEAIKELREEVRELKLELGK